MTLTFSLTPASENPCLKAVTPLSPAQLKRRARFAKLFASLAVPQNTSIAGVRAAKAKPATGVMGSS